MAEPILDQPTTLGSDYVQSVNTGEALFSDAYDFSPPSVPMSATELDAAAVKAEAVETTFAEESAYRIMNDIKAIDEARENQETLWGPTFLAANGLLILNGLLMRGRLGAVSVATGVGALAFSIAHGFKDGADWKQAADDMNSVFDELLERQQNGELKAQDVERFASLMHNLPVESLKEILDEGQREKYEMLIANVAKKNL